MVRGTIAVVGRMSGPLVATLGLVLVACSSGGPVAPTDVFLPRLDGPPPQYPAALIEWTLVEDHGCLELTHLYLSAEFSSTPGQVVLPLWPEGSTATRTEDGAIHLDAPGLPAVETGQRISMGGGFERPLDGAEHMIGGQIPAACQTGVYWVATPVHS